MYSKGAVVLQAMRVVDLAVFGEDAPHAASIAHLQFPVAPNREPMEPSLYFQQNNFVDLKIHDFSIFCLNINEKKVKTVLLCLSMSC